MSELNEKISSITQDLNLFHETRKELEERIATQKNFDTIIKRDFRGILLQNCITYINKKRIKCNYLLHIY